MVLELTGFHFTLHNVFGMVWVLLSLPFQGRQQRQKPSENNVQIENRSPAQGRSTLSNKMSAFGFPGSPGPKSRHEDFLFYPSFATQF